MKVQCIINMYDIVMSRILISKSKSTFTLQEY